MIKERPILFSAAMVRAILEGRKIQTRRIAKVTSEGCGSGMITPTAGFVPRSIANHICYCPYGEPGDMLWVRETFSYHEIPEGEPFYYPADRLRECIDHDYGYHYWADGQPDFGNWSKPKPSIHMPRRASRIMLEITDIRIERLNAISEKDSISEGVDGEKEAADIGCTWHEKPKRAYRRLWESINGKGSWDLNPWVWMIEFRKVQK